MEKTTEKDSRHRHLEQKSVKELLTLVNNEDQSVALAVAKCIPDIERLVESIIPKIIEGGRLIYIGAGTSGRLGILDASECPPTFGVPHELVVGLIAGGDSAIRKAVEFAEDNRDGAWVDLEPYLPNKLDTIIGIAASGTTPYVVGGLRKARKMGIKTGCITCNSGSPLEEEADFPIVCIVGPEFVTGSTRMKAGTAQKLILNMISTTVMIGLGRVVDNKMVDMQLSNNKLVERGTKLVANATDLSLEEAKEVLLQEGSVRKAMEKLKKNK